VEALQHELCPAQMQERQFPAMRINSMVWIVRPVYVTDHQHATLDVGLEAEHELCELSIS
jgi:hypothetical protein